MVYHRSHIIDCVFIKEPCPCGLPVVMTIAHMTYALCRKGRDRLLTCVYERMYSK